MEIFIWLQILLIAELVLHICQHLCSMWFLWPLQMCTTLWLVFLISFSLFFLKLQNLLSDFISQLMLYLAYLYFCIALVLNPFFWINILTAQICPNLAIPSVTIQKTLISYTVSRAYVTKHHKAFLSYVPIWNFKLIWCFYPQ